MSWSVLQSCKGTATSGATISAGGTGAAPAGWASNLTSGSTLIAAVSGINIGTGSSSVKDAANNAFIKIASVSDASNCWVELWALNTPAGDAGTKPVITATAQGGSSGGYSILVQEVSGIITSSTAAGFRDGAAGTSTATQVGAGSIGPPVYSDGTANEYLVYLYGDTGSGRNPTKPAAYTADPNNVVSTFNGVCSIAYANSTAGTETGQWSLNGSATYGLILVAFQLATGGPPATPAAGLASSAATADALTAMHGTAAGPLWAAAASAVTGAWTSASSADGPPDGSSASWTSVTAADSAGLELSGFTAQPAVPSAALVGDVQVTIWHSEVPAAAVSSVTAQLFKGAVAVGDPQPLTVSAVLHPDTITIPGLTWADLADVRVRVTAARP